MQPGLMIGFLLRERVWLCEASGSVLASGMAERVHCSFFHHGACLVRDDSRGPEVILVVVADRKRDGRNLEIEGSLDTHEEGLAGGDKGGVVPGKPQPPKHRRP